jgi:hypothetical protein
VVLADSEHVQADLVGELDLLDQLAQPAHGRDGAAALGLRPQDCIRASGMG